MRIYSHFINFHLLLFLIVAAIVAYIPYFNIHGASATILGCVALAIIALAPVSLGALSVAFAIPFALGTAEVFGGYNLNLGIQAVLLLKLFISNEGIFNTKNFLTIVFSCLLIQLSSIILFDQSFKNVFQLIVNILLLIAFYTVIRKKYVSYIQVFGVFSFGVLASCLVADYGSFTIVDAEYIGYDFFRFSGLWTDPNFIGFFCNFVVATILALCEGRLVKLLMMSPFILISVSYGFRTLSFTYVLILSSLIIFYLLSYRNLKNMLLILVVLAIVVIPFLYDKLDAMLAARIVGDDSDFSHGRLTSSTEIMEVLFSRPGLLLLGTGYGNLLNAFKYIGHQRDLGSHNSYVDLLAEFGLIFNLISIFVLLSIKDLYRKYMRPLFSLYGLPVLILFIYMASISGLKYDFFFIIIGCYIANIHNVNENQDIGNNQSAAALN